MLAMRLAIALFVGLLATSPIRALAADDPELADAQADFDRQLAAFDAGDRDGGGPLRGSGDCALACRALESLRRAADRLCALDPGDACTDARAKLRDAAERVRVACPECAAAATVPTPRTSPVPADSTTVHASAAPGKGGGCAGCATTSGTDVDGAWLAAAIAACAALRRRARRPR